MPYCIKSKDEHRFNIELQVDRRELNESWRVGQAHY